MSDNENGSGQTRGQATREDILNVARRLFADYGYHSTGIADIQQATGLTKGAFYHHFRSKQDLAMAVLERARSDYSGQMFEPAMVHASAGERIRALLDRAIALNQRPEWCNCQLLVTLSAELTAEDARLRDAVREMRSAMLDVWCSLLAAARESGEMNTEIRPEVAAEWVINSMTGLFLSRKIGTDQASAQDLVDLIKHALLKEGAVPATAGRDGDSRVED